MLGKALGGKVRLLTVGRLQGRNFETRIDSIDRIDRSYTRRLRAVRLSAVGKDFGGLAGLRLKLLLEAPGCSLEKALDGWAAAAPGYRRPHR